MTHFRSIFFVWDSVISSAMRDGEKFTLVSVANIASRIHLQGRNRITEVAYHTAAQIWTYVSTCSVEMPFWRASFAYSDRPIERTCASGCVQARSARHREKS